MAGDFDNAFRRMMAARPSALLGWILGQPSTATDGWRAEPSELAARPVRLDGLFVRAGPSGADVLQLEIEHRARPADIGDRLYRDNYLLKERYGTPPDQHVLVLTDVAGRLRSHHRIGRGTVDYDVHHAWQLDLETVLADPWLAPLAPLTSADSAQRETLFTTAARVIVERAPPADRTELLQHAVTYAGAYLTPDTLRSLLRKALTMPLNLEDFPLAQGLLDEGKRAGRAEGERAGRAEGERSGRIELLTRLLERRFGQLDPGALALLHQLDAAGCDALAEQFLDLADATALTNWLRATVAQQPTPDG